jgi:hypothetical protein
MTPEMALKEYGATGSIDVASRIVNAPDLGGTPGKTPDEHTARRAGHGA